MFLPEDQEVNKPRKNPTLEPRKQTLWQLSLKSYVINECNSWKVTVIRFACVKIRTNHTHILVEHFGEDVPIIVSGVGSSLSQDSCQDEFMCMQNFSFP